ILTVNGLSGAFWLKQLDEMNAEFAMRDPRGFRSAAGEQVSVGEDGLHIELLPFAIARLDSA
ncbi:MAG: hypothetical protein IAE80_23870, partial [Anaerolinea sp.]|nr:hypothetical protein [Anaerolinea sp.]